MKKSLNIFVIILTILFLTATVYAASSPWTETDWSGGGFDSSSNVTTSTAGQVTLANTEELSNTGFESDLTSWSEVPSYTLNDQFTTDRSAGAVNGTSAEPTGGTRTVVDTNFKLSISSSQLSFATGNATSDGIWYGSTTRTSGLVYLGTINLTAGYPSFGFDTNQSGGIGESNMVLSTNSTLYLDGLGVINAGTLGSGTYQVAIVLRGTGTYYYIKGGTFTNWTLLWIKSTGSTATLYPAFTSLVSTFVGTADNIRIPTSTWLPTPLAYDTFTRSDGAIGSSETTGPDSQTTPSLAWTAGAISGNKLIITPSLGSELLTDGGLENWTSPTNLTSWTEFISGTSTVNQEAALVHSGSYAAREDFDVSGNQAYLKQVLVNPNGAWLYIDWWGRTSAAGKTLRVSTEAVFGATRDPGTTYTHYVDVIRSQQNNDLVYGVKANSNSSSLYFDDVSVKPITLSSLFSTVSTSDADVIADATVSLTAGTQAGIVTNLDSTTTPANFIIVYLSST